MDGWFKVSLDLVQGYVVVRIRFRVDLRFIQVSFRVCLGFGHGILKFGLGYI
jgi:hypothetical protein